MTNSIYATPQAELRNFFAQVDDPSQILCGPIDYAKSHHTVLFCNGQGEILKKAFPVENSRRGLEQLLTQLQATCHHRNLSSTHAFFGGEDVPAWAENFITALRAKGFPVAQVNAWEAHNHRKNFQASSDALDLLGIAQCLLEFRARLTPAVTDHYRRLREFCRERQSLVTATTALTNRLTNYVDRLFPHFLDAAQSGIPPFSPACWALLQDRFSAPHLARRRPRSLMLTLQRHGLAEATAAVTTLQALARQVLPPAEAYVGPWQKMVQTHAAQWQVQHRLVAELDTQIGALLAQSPGAFLTSVSGLGITLAAGLVSELGDPAQWPGLNRLCSYAGVIPASKQSGGPNQPPVSLGVRPRCNHFLKNYLLQGAQKIGRMGPPALQERYQQVQARQGAADFVLAKALLSLGKSLVQRQAVYLPPTLYAPDSTAAERGAYYQALWPKLLAKWQPKVPASVVFAPEAPLGQWRQMVQAQYEISLPLPQPVNRAPAQARPSTQGASPARLK